MPQLVLVDGTLRNIQWNIKSGQGWTAHQITVEFEPGELINIDVTQGAQSKKQILTQETQALVGQMVRVWCRLQVSQKNGQGYIKATTIQPFHNAYKKQNQGNYGGQYQQQYQQPNFQQPAQPPQTQPAGYGGASPAGNPGVDPNLGWGPQQPQPQQQQQPQPQQPQQDGTFGADDDLPF